MSSSQQGQTIALADGSVMVSGARKRRTLCIWNIGANPCVIGMGIQATVINGIPLTAAGGVESRLLFTSDYVPEEQINIAAVTGDTAVVILEA